MRWNIGTTKITHLTATQTAIKSAYLHLFTDVFTSVAVLAGGLAIKYFGFTWIDSLLSILIAIYLIYTSWGILMETLRVVMQFAPAGVNLTEVETAINELPMVANIHQIRGQACAIALFIQYL